MNEYCYLCNLCDEILAVDGDSNVCYACEVSEEMQELVGIATYLVEYD